MTSKMKARLLTVMYNVYTKYSVERKENQGTLSGISINSAGFVCRDVSTLKLDAFEF